MTYYDVLEVSQTASKEVIEASWKALQRRFHPDGTNPNANHSKLINQAHDVLSDPKNRARYDSYLKSQRPQPVKIAARKQESVQVQRRRVQAEIRNARDFVDDMIDLANRAFDLFTPTSPVRVTRRRR
jgi:curved DNA-binding protein CbpA